MYDIAIVGAGRVGSVLGAALAAAGHRVVAASGGPPSASPATAARIQLLLPAAASGRPEQVAAAGELLIISVPDDALAGLVARLAEVGAFRPGQIIVHTSGAHGLAVLAPVAAAGARTLALHPAMTFTGTPLDLDRLARGISFGATAGDGARGAAQRLVADLGGVIEWVPEESRVLYHAALAHGANHLVTLVNDALDRLRDAGVRDPERMLGPLLGAALDNTLALGDAALTGPVSRGDAGTVAGHLATLRATAPQAVPPYRALARRTVDRAIAAGRLRPDAAGPLLDVLAFEPGRTEHAR